VRNIFKTFPSRRFVARPRSIALLCNIRLLARRPPQVIQAFAHFGVQTVTYILSSHFC